MSKSLSLQKFEKKLESSARALAKTLKKTNSQLVLVESCTGGMAAAALTRIPGISEHFCGSCVAYQSETKQAWLKIPRSKIQKFGTESKEMSELLTSCALRQTHRATIAAAITGHLGPTGNVGVIFMACEFRNKKTTRRFVSENLLENVRPSRKMRRGNNERHSLQLLASQCLLDMVRHMLSDTLR